jgi:hypothetical protein
MLRATVGDDAAETCAPKIDPRRPRRRRHAAPVVAAGLLAASACGGADEATSTATAPASGATSASSDVPAGPRDPHRDDPSAEPVGEPADREVRAELLGELTEAFAAVRSGPVLIELEMDEDTPSTASIRVDQSRGLVDATWVQTTRRGSEIVTRNVVVDDRTFFKSTAGEEAAAALDFVEVDRASGDALLENVFTAYGRIGPSLDRLLLFVETLPFRFAAEQDRSIRRWTVAIEPIDVIELFVETGLEVTGPGVPHAPMVLEFAVDAGRLVGIEAAGTQFHDGEPLELTASLRYRSIESFEVEVPPTDS